MLNTSLITKMIKNQNKKPRKKTEKEIFEIPKKYTKGLTKKRS